MESTMFIEDTLVNLTPDGTNHWSSIAKLIAHKKAQLQNDAFYVTNLSVILTQWKKWAQYMPNIHPHYAVKANPDPTIIKLMTLLGANFDCASKGEIDLVLSMGAKPNRIIFANTIKPIDHIRYSKAVGIDLMTFDNEMELRKIHATYPEARLVLRIAVSDTTAISQLSLKFGCDAITQAPKLLRLAKDLHMSIVGISFHVGGGGKNPAAFADGIGHARALFGIGKDIGLNMYLLDVGGGYPGFCSQVSSLFRISLFVNEAIRTHFTDLPEVKVIAEPGRFFAMPSSTLCSSIIGKTTVPAQLITNNIMDYGEGYMYYAADGIFGSFNCVPVYKIKPPAIAYGKDYSKLFWSKVWGPTCDSADCILPKGLLPMMDIGDWLVYEYMGAYTRCIASNFNGISPSEVHYMMTFSDSAFVCNLLLTSSKETLDLGLEISDGDNTDSAIASPVGAFSSSTNSIDAQDDGDEEPTTPIIKTIPVLEQ